MNAIPKESPNMNAIFSRNSNIDKIPDIINVKNAKLDDTKMSIYNKFIQSNNGNIKQKVLNKGMNYKNVLTKTKDNIIKQENIYINNNTRYLTRKYESLFDQITKIKFDKNDKIIKSQNLRSNINNEMTLSDDWNHYRPSLMMFNEPETWNVISFTNKCHSYGKSLRFADRFYSNWAKKLTLEIDRKTQQSTNSAIK